MLNLSEARAQLLAVAPPPPATETLPLHRETFALLRGRVLASAVRARLDHPDAPRSRMDGYAMRADDGATGQSLPVAGATLPGEAAGTLPAAAAWRVGTGSVLPRGADAVVPQEEVQLVPAQGQAPESVQLLRAADSKWVRAAGEDIHKGQELLSAGTVLNERQLLLAAAAGVGELEVHRRLRLGLLHFGPELVAIGGPLPEGGQYELSGLLLTSYLEDLRTQLCAVDKVADDLDATRTALRQAAAKCDLVLTTGGASVGQQDFAAPALRAEGDILFQRVRMRPGMPFMAGRIGAVPVLALPGNPLSAFATFQLLAKPLIRKMQGATESPPEPLPAHLRTDASNDSDHLLLLQARCQSDGERLWVAPATRQHSALLSPLAAANCILELAPRQSSAAGDPVPIWLYQPHV